MNKKDLLLELHKIHAIKFGTFTLKSGLSSPIYVDLRAIVTYPILLRAIANLLWEKIAPLQSDFICGVPYTALPIATCLSLLHEKPMLLRRKEVKAHGTKKMVEGVYKKGQTCLVIEDVVTTGSSVLETISDLETEGLKVTHVAAFLDREQGAKKTLGDRGYQLHSVLTLDELLNETTHVRS